MRRDIDTTLAQLAGSQHGVFTYRQVLEAGGYRQLVARRISSGDWVHVTHAAYAQRATSLAWESKACAAVLSTPESALSARAAARLHAIGPFGRVPVEVLAPFGSNARGRAYTIHRCRHFEPIARTEVAGIRVLTIAETLGDLARREPRLLVQRITEETILARRVTIDELAAVASRKLDDWCPGGVLLGSVLRDIGGEAVPESELERRMARLLAGVSTPPVVRQMTMPWWSSGNGRVDFAIPAWRLLIECDGRRWHAKTIDFERDRERDNAATLNGWKVLRFTYRMIESDPEGCVAAIVSLGSSVA
jgi:very-short-patch-repair endonuclease